MAQTTRDLTAASSLIDEADRALYRTKELGRNRVVFATAAAAAA